jgi:hypothetical protein
VSSIGAVSHRLTKDCLRTDPAHKETVKQEAGLLCSASLGNAECPLPTHCGHTESLGNCYAMPRPPALRDWHDKASLEKLYFGGGGLSTVRIASRYGASSPAVLKLMS